MTALHCHARLEFQRCTLVLVSTAFALHAAVATAQTDFETWGPAVKGLQARVLSVAAETLEERTFSFADAERASTFDRPEDITLLVQLKNVGEQPIKLLGVRYSGEVRESHRGRSDSAFFAPLFYQCDFFDSSEHRVLGPINKAHPVDVMTHASIARVEILKPTESVVALLRPGQWDPSLTRLIASGDYRLRVHYRGVTTDIQQRFRKYNREMPADLWSGDAVAPDVAVRVHKDSTGWGNPSWGEPLEGLRSAIQLYHAAQAGQPTVAKSSTYSHGSRVESRFLIENVSNREISFWSEDPRQSDELTLIYDDGSEDLTRNDVWDPFSNSTRHWTLRPKQIAVLRAIDILLLTAGRDREPQSKPARPLYAASGHYKLRYDLRFGGWTRRDGFSLQDVPRPEDWQETLPTGVVPIEMIDPEPE